MTNHFSNHFNQYPETKIYYFIKTSAVAKLAGAEVIRHPKNMGKGMALRTGFRHAGKNGCKVIITMDSDASICLLIKILDPSYSEYEGS